MAGKYESKDVVSTSWRWISPGWGVRVFRTQACATRARQCKQNGVPALEAHETMCTQHGKASTEKRFMPQSKMRILGSGTPRLYRDFGYGLFLICL